MKLASTLFDKRVQANNVLVEMKIGEYIELVEDIISKNEFQRKRVRSSKTVYALLKKDLQDECVIPSIVLAITKNINITDDDIFRNELMANKESLLILDGLQRTLTIMDLLDDYKISGNENALRKLKDNTLRIEIYINLNRLGVLYRMLTLNTGQTPMSLRQQIEMLYLDYLDNDLDGIQLIRESDVRAASQVNQYNFKEMIEGFNAYLDRDELPMDRADILENIDSLEKLSKENQNTELFELYVKSIHSFILKIVDLCGNTELNREYLEVNNSPFGRNALQVFKKPQVYSGYGAAIGRLVDFEVISGFVDIDNKINGLEIDNPEEFLEKINDSLIWIKNNSKKIGNAQRIFFAYFFRDLFNEDSNVYLNPILASSSALRKYQAQYM